MLTYPLYFEDLKSGYTVDTPKRTITQADVEAFAQLSGDHNLLHVDAEYAATTFYGERIAHGLLTLSIATGLADSLGILKGTIEAFTAIDWKFRKPIKDGDTVYARVTVRRKRSLPGYSGGFVTFKVIVLNQNKQTVQKGNWTILVRGRRAV